jgi:uncharacterized protein DUF5631/uncharacterized protein DUF5632
VLLSDLLTHDYPRVRDGLRRLGMAGDLPVGKYTAALIGAWWPQPSSTLRAGAQHWSAQAQLQEQHAQELHSQWTALAAANQGHTADDLVSRFQQGEKFSLDLAEKYQVKASAFEKGADAIDSLREGLRGIADDYNQRIANIENSKEPAPMKAAEIEELISEANGFAAHKSGAAVAVIMDATQSILNAEGIALSPQEFLESQGLGAGKQPAMGGGIGSTGQSGSGGQSVSPMGAGLSGGNAGRQGVAGASGQGGQATSPFGTGIGQPSGVGGSAPVGAPTGAGQIPGAPGLTSPLQGSQLSPAANLGGLSPNQLSNSFSTGMMAGQPAADGAHNLSDGLMNATGASTTPPQSPTAPPISAPTVTGGVESAMTNHGVTDPSAAVTTHAPSEPTGGGSVPMATPMVGGGSVPAPMTPAVGAAPAPAGPLPAYGSDLRPPVLAAPTISAPTSPVSGAPVAPSPSTSPSAGSSLMSAVQRTSSAEAGSSAATPAAAAALSATTGAAAGDVSSRAVEQQRLQRLVDAVARQAPGLSWAAGLRDDGTTLLVSNIGCGWVPPNVKIPVGVNRLLEPALRRRDASVVDLLGAVTAAAVHAPNEFIAKPGPDDPALTGDRVARSGPKVDELGPTLVEAVRRHDGLPRIAQTLAQAATRGTGVTDNELDLLQTELRSAHQKALKDPHDLSRAADWMLLAAIDALAEGHESLAHYHVAWYEAVGTKLR